MTVPSSVFKAANKVVVPGLASSLTFNAPAGSHIRSSLALRRLIAETVAIVTLFARQHTSRVLRKVFQPPAPSLLSLANLTRRGSATLSFQERGKGNKKTPSGREDEGKAASFQIQGVEGKSTVV